MAPSSSGEWAAENADVGERGRKQAGDLDDREEAAAVGPIERDTRMA